MAKAHTARGGFVADPQLPRRRRDRKPPTAPVVVLVIIVATSHVLLRHFDMS